MSAGTVRSLGAGSGCGVSAIAELSLAPADLMRLDSGSNGNSGAPESASDILKVMPIQHSGLYLLVLAGLCCIGVGVWVIKLSWRKLSDYMRNQRFGE